MKFRDVYYLIESPDSSVSPHGTLSKSSDSTAFMYYKNKLRVFIGTITHYEYFINDIEELKHHSVDSQVNAWKKAYPEIQYNGILWNKQKHISFWKYPLTKKELSKFINDISKSKYAINITDDWTIDVSNLEFKYLKKLESRDYVPISEYKKIIK